MFRLSIVRTFLTNQSLTRSYRHTQVLFNSTLSSANHVNNNKISETKITTIEGSSTSNITENVDKLTSIDTEAVKQATTKLKPSETFKWDVTPDPLSSIIPSEVTGPVMPWVAQTFFQKCLFLFNYPLMYSLSYFSGFMPMWASIASTTVLLRIASFPLFVWQHQTAVKISNCQPEIQKARVRLNDAMAYGDEEEMLKCRNKMFRIHKDKGISNMDKFAPNLLQSPFYLGMFLLLRQLTDRYPIESFKTGGIAWFTDLTAPDPFYILPLITAVSLRLTFSSTMGNQTTGVRWFFNIIPIVVFGFVQQFPAGLLLFWSISNTTTLCYTLLMQRKFASRLFNIPEKIEHKSEDLPFSNVGFKSQYQKLIDSATSMRPKTDLRRLDDIEFRKAGSGPLRKTHKVPPSTLN